MVVLDTWSSAPSCLYPADSGSAARQSSQSLTGPAESSVEFSQVPTMAAYSSVPAESQPVSAMPDPDYPCADKLVSPQCMGFVPSTLGSDTEPSGLLGVPDRISPINSMNPINSINSQFTCLQGARRDSAASMFQSPNGSICMTSKPIYSPVKDMGFPQYEPMESMARTAIPSSVPDGLINANKGLAASPTLSYHPNSPTIISGRRTSASSIGYGLKSQSDPTQYSDNIEQTLIDGIGQWNSLQGMNQLGQSGQPGSVQVPVNQAMRDPATIASQPNMNLNLNLNLVNYMSQSNQPSDYSENCQLVNQPEDYAMTSGPMPLQSAGSAQSGDTRFLAPKEIWQCSASGMVLHEIAHMAMASTHPRPSYLPPSLAERSRSASPSLPATPMSPATPMNQTSSSSIASAQSEWRVSKGYASPESVAAAPISAAKTHKSGYHQHQPWPRSHDSQNSQIAEIHELQELQENHTPAAQAQEWKVEVTSPSAISLHLPQFLCQGVTPSPELKSEVADSPSSASGVPVGQTNVDQMMLYVQAIERGRAPVSPPNSASSSCGHVSMSKISKAGHSHSGSPAWRVSGGAGGRSHDPLNTPPGSLESPKSIQESPIISASTPISSSQTQPHSYIQSHSQSQHGEPKYACSFPNCGKSFRQRAHLDTHIRSHTGERPFSCPFEGCTKCFSQQCNLRTHMRAHTGERPYSCEICDKSFSQRGNLRNHMLTHSQARPLACRLDGCTKTFNQLGNLKVHHNSAHAETLAAFTRRLQTSSTETLTAEEQEMFTYFCSLYRNANRGIRGRGKGTRSIANLHR